MDITKKKYSLLDKALAWAVHLFTASGMLAGFMAILAIQAHDWRKAMLWLIVGLFIDGIDGTFARKFEVTKVLPHMNGKTIDYVIDFANYAIIPAYFFYEAALVDAEPWRLIATFLILLVSAIYYGKEGMVSEDYYFVGFPVLWNIVVFYLVFVFQLPSWGNFGVILLFGLLHFVPLEFPYPSRQEGGRIFTAVMAGLFFVGMMLLVWAFPKKDIVLRAIVLISGLYFLFLGFFKMYKNRSTKQ